MIEKKSFGKICWINPDSISEMSDPHAKRYYTALRLFLGELLRLVDRWNLSVIEEGDKDSVFIALPNDKDEGIYLTWEPKKEEEVMGKCSSSDSPEPSRSAKEILTDWLKGLLGIYKFESYVQFTKNPPSDVSARARIYTDKHVYSITAKVEPQTGRSYLGCVCSCRQPYAGEDWTRGSDLPDGEFNRKTWERIKSGIIRSELVALGGK